MSGQVNAQGMEAVLYTKKAVRWRCEQMIGMGSGLCNSSSGGVSNVPDV